MTVNRILDTVLSDRYRFLQARPAAWAASIGMHAILIYLMSIAPVPQF